MLHNDIFINFAKKIKSYQHFTANNLYYKYVGKYFIGYEKNDFYQTKFIYQVEMTVKEKNIEYNFSLGYGDVF
jgi:hypothetical protein